MLEGAVLAVAGLPRVSLATIASGAGGVAAPASAHGGGGGPGSCIPTTALAEQLVQDALQVRARARARSHSATPAQLAANVSRMPTAWSEHPADLLSSVRCLPFCNPSILLHHTLCSALQPTWACRSTPAAQELRDILCANTSAPQQLAGLFEPFLFLLQLDPAAHAAAFAESERTRQGWRCSCCSCGLVAGGAAGQPVPMLSLECSSAHVYSSACLPVFSCWWCWQPRPGAVCC